MNRLIFAVDANPTVAFHHRKKLNLVWSGKTDRPWTSCSETAGHERFCLGEFEDVGKRIATHSRTIAQVIRTCKYSQFEMDRLLLMWVVNTTAYWRTA